MDGIKIEITGKLVTECLIQLKLNEILFKLKEIRHEIENLEKQLDYTPDYDAYLRADRYLR
jgi:uncharacterized protein with PhoU and TrkA domain